MKYAFFSVFHFSIFLEQTKICKVDRLVSVCGSQAPFPWHSLPPVKVRCVTCGSWRTALPASPLCVYEHNLPWRRERYWAFTPSVAKRGTFMGRTVRGCSVLVGAQAELAVSSP